MHQPRPDTAESSATRAHFALCRRVARAAVVSLLVFAACQSRGADVEQELPAGAGLRELPGKHVTITTDLASSPEIDALPDYFDQAFPQWCAYFGVDEKEHADWHVRVCLMRSEPRFVAAGLIPDDLPNFLNGFMRGDRIWMNDQNSDYYRRHLLLHEGTHAFADSLVAGLGPPWFSEGIAELLATHRLVDGHVELNYFPRRREEVPRWGRIEIVNADYHARRAMSLTKLLGLEGQAYLKIEPYGWSWAVAAFLDGHPRYRARFRRLPRLAGAADFAAVVRKLFADDWAQLNEDWQLFVANLDYGYDFARNELQRDQGKPLTGSSVTIAVDADRGWQSSGVRLEAGRSYRLRAMGRYQVAPGPPPWESEPGGVSIRYYRGRPLGILLAAIRADESDGKGANGLLTPLVVGLETTFRAPRTGTLYLRVNQSSGQLDENAGTLSVEIAER